ncbi:hypothetical protein CC86DRAFT_457940 [Ophiobolus disseminans]|uniref:Uncharacterized protein n=1 Tax=Ophiobolus disseminans TaxID=1469910 RepID=A0A6A6ZPI7_9PLEO|nr:hypothetical protein CC86DRAFT_457940 [Ophiobolus disseminans]
MAPRTTPRWTLPPPPTPGRDSSPELGSPSKITQYNKSTGRPIRKSAGRVKKVAGYVDSALLDEEEFDPLTSDSTTDDGEDDMTPRGRVDKAKQRQKRKRSPSPPSPRLEPVIYNQELDELTDDATSDSGRRTTPKKSPVTLQFNVPLGFHGPLFVKLDRALLAGNEEGVRHDMYTSRAKKARISSSSPARTDEAVRPKGFADFPPELRNSVYRHVFVRDGSLQIPQRSEGSGLGQSAQFLRTCKLVHNEACSILYGENTFAFKRHHDTRAPFWDPKPREVGYQDFLHFLKMIGPESIQYLRDLCIEFDDALPKHSPNLTIETRRYVVDDYLMNCLRILREAKLRKVSLMFLGRRQLFRSDIKFLGYLEQIKADEVVKLNQPWPFAVKIGAWVWDVIKDQMTRKKKLYEKK